MRSVYTQLYLLFHSTNMKTTSHVYIVLFLLCIPFSIATVILLSYTVTRSQKNKDDPNYSLKMYKISF